MAEASRDPDQLRRLLSLAEIYDGGSRGDAARIGDVGLQTVRDWVLRFREFEQCVLGGFSNLAEPLGRSAVCQQIAVGVGDLALAVPQYHVVDDFKIGFECMYLRTQIGSHEFQDEYEPVRITLVRGVTQQEERIRDRRLRRTRVRPGLIKWKGQAAS